MYRWQFGILALVLVCSCGGGGGGGGSPADPGSDTPDEAMATGLASLIASPGSPSSGARQVALSVAEIVDSSATPEEADARLDAVFSSAVQTAQDLDALDRAWRHPDARAALVELNDTSGQGSTVLGVVAPSNALAFFYVNGIAVRGEDYERRRAKLEAIIKDVVPGARVRHTYQVSALDKEVSVFGSRVCPPPSEEHHPLTNALLGTLCPVLGWVADFSEAAVQKAWALFGSASIVGVGQSLELAEEILAQHMLGKVSILIGHSQGNFFIRDALRILDQNSPEALDSVRVIMLASPESAETVADLLRPGRVSRISNDRDFVPACDLVHGACEHGCAPTLVPILPNPIRPHFLVEGYLSGRPFERLLREVRRFSGVLVPAPRSIPETDLVELPRDTRIADVCAFSNGDRVVAMTLEGTGGLVLDSAAGGQITVPGFGNSTRRVCVIRLDAQARALWVATSSRSSESGLIDASAVWCGVFSNGDVLIAGSSDGKVVFGEGESGERELVWNGSYLARFRGDSGSLLWVREIADTFNGSGGIGIRGCAIGPEDEIYIGGDLRGATFGLGEPDEVRIGSFWPDRAFAAKFGGDGDFKWAADMTDGSGETVAGAEVSALAVSGDGEQIAFCGDFQGGTVMGTGGQSDEYDTSAHYGTQGLLGALDPDGTLLWSASTTRVGAGGGAYGERFYDVHAVGGSAFTFVQAADGDLALTDVGVLEDADVGLPDIHLLSYLGTGGFLRSRRLHNSERYSGFRVASCAHLGGVSIVFETEGNRDKPPVLAESALGELVGLDVGRSDTWVLCRYDALGNLHELDTFGQELGFGGLSIPTVACASSGPTTVEVLMIAGEDFRLGVAGSAPTRLTVSGGGDTQIVAASCTLDGP